MAKQTISFNPKARLIKILGEHLIKDATVGIIELVKNSYDADATEVEIKMISLNKKNSKIIIKDNGHGISLPVFMKKWMNPATGHKEEEKKELIKKKERTKHGRLPLGEKGVGRFAVQQIGDHLKMISKTLDTNQELVVECDWKRFDNYHKDLKDILVDYEMRIPEIYDYKETGTILEITEIRKIDWTVQDISKITTSLRRMKSPFKGANDFDVSLAFEDCPKEFNDYSDLEMATLLEKAPHRFYCIVDNNGVMDFEYDFILPGSQKRHEEGQLNLVTKIKKEKDDILLPIKCGGFIINAYYFQRDPEWIKKTNIQPKKELDDISGISVYRDGIRIFPYGEKGDDWLGLDKGRIQSTDKIHNNNIVGLVEINQVENPQLKDKTNREGLIENLEYQQFHQLVLRALSEFEKEIKEDSPKKLKQRESPAVDTKRNTDSIKENLSKVISNIAKSSDPKVAQAAPLLKEVFEKIFENEKQHEETIEEYEKSSKMLVNLAGTGLAAERFTHEFARIVMGALNSVERLKNNLLPPEVTPKTKKELDAITSALEALRNNIRLLGPLFYVRKTAKEKSLSIKQQVLNAMSLQEHVIEKEKIKVEIEGEDFIVQMREGDCIQVVNNILDNSIFWVSGKSEVDQKRIKFILDKKENTLYVSDSGPGINTRDRARIFDPFFSRKADDGRGLGLYIVKEILDEKDFGVFVVDKDDHPKLLNGATFKISFNKIP